MGAAGQAAPSEQQVFDDLGDTLTSERDKLGYEPTPRTNAAEEIAQLHRAE